MTSDRFPQFGSVGFATSYRTEPALRSGAELPKTSTLIVGQREPDPSPKAAIFLGKMIEQTAAKSYFNYAVWLDATFPHVALIAGKRGSGKSYDLGIIAEGLCAPDSAIAFGTEKFAMVLFDTQNQFWTLGRSGSRLPASDAAQLAKWNIGQVEIASPVVYRPRGTTSLADFETEFAIRPSDLEPDDWTALCGLDRYSAMGQCLRAARASMIGHWSVSNMVEWLGGEEPSQRFAQATIDAVVWRLEAMEGSELFSPEAEDITVRLAASGSKSVVQLAELDDDTKSVIVAVIMRKLIRWAGPAQRKKKMANLLGQGVDNDQAVAPRIWVLIDEAHLVCPSDRATAARPVIVDFVKRGRDAGLSLVLATQQPSALDTAAISQNDLVAMHKLTIDSDIAAATARMPARMPARVTKLPRTIEIPGMDELARSLDAGQSLFADAESSRAFILQSRPRVSPHGGGEPQL